MLRTATTEHVRLAWRLLLPPTELGVVAEWFRAEPDSINQRSEACEMKTQTDLTAGVGGGFYAGGAGIPYDLYWID